MNIKALQTVRGTHDLVGESMRLHRFVADTAQSVAALYGCAEMATPVFEFSDVFHRTLGTSSDVVAKETYTFEDRGGESLTLRPEFTASIVRAFISGGHTQSLPFKVFYSGPAFRYERPQKGRQRQFHQVGVEVLGADSPLADVEMIACGAHMLRALGLEKHVTLELNSLGDVASREAYRETLVEYLTANKDVLSPESQTRLEVNPLRVLDSKQPEDAPVIAAAPKLEDSFTPEAKEWFAAVTHGLDVLGIPYAINPQLVRGLDYYSHTVFEFTTQALGSQNTVLAGGRYDGLVAQMGGPDVTGIGFAAGMERLALLMEEVGADANLPHASAPVMVMPFGETEQRAALQLLQALRNSGVTAEMLLSGNMGKRMKKANKQGAKHAVLIGEEERAAGEATIKHLVTGEQERVPFDAVAASLAEQQ